jgi:HEAT repeat protein
MMVENTHIFVSYRSIEADFALKLASSLKNAGVRIWMDRLDGGIKDGEDWRRSIEQALTKESCASVIAILSPDYVTSEYCRNELARANRLKIPIYPVLLRTVPDEQWPLEIERLQYIDFQAWLDGQVYQEKLDRLIQELREAFPAQFSTVPDLETRYLNSLIAELESRRGILEYVEMATEADAQEVRPRPPVDDEWGFTLLVDSNSLAIADGLRQRKESFETIAAVHEKLPRFVLVGDPGAGKTTAIRHLARDAARRRLSNPRTSPLPLLLYLPQWGNEASPIDFVRAHWPFLTDPRGSLRNGDVILYLDGLNEIGSTGREKAQKLRLWLDSPDAPQSVIVTCRAADYTQLRLGNIPMVLVKPLNDAQIRQFTANYLKGKLLNEFLAQVLEPDFLVRARLTNARRFEDTRYLLQLTHNPYMLSALIIVFQNGGELPRNTGTLFHRLAMALWQREQKRHTLGWIPFEKAKAAFARLAFAIIDEKQPTDVSMSYALRHVNAALLRVGMSANFVTISGKQVRFSHQLMQEYFAAVRLQAIGIKKRLKEPGYAWDEGGEWGQVVIALAGIGDSDTIVQQVMSINQTLAAKSIASGVKVSNATHDVVIEDWLEVLSHSATPWALDNSVNLLIGLGDRAVPGLLNILQQHRLGRFIRAGAVKALGEIGNPVVVPELIKALSDSETPVRYNAGIALGAIGDKLAVPGLIALLQDKDEDVRLAAIQALGQIGETHALPDLLKLLQDENGKVRHAAIVSLAKIKNPLAVPGLIALLQDKDKDIRLFATWALGIIPHADAIPGLIERLSDTDTQVCYVENMEEEEVRICDVAAWALENIGTPEALETVRQWRHEQDPQLSPQLEP